MRLALDRCDDVVDGLVWAGQGADTVIYERLDHANIANMLIKDSTRQHMEEFGAAGLRTLCLSYAQLDEQEYDAYVS